MIADRARFFCTALVFLCAANAPPVFAQSEFFIEDQSLLAGAQNQELVLQVNADVTFLGFQFGLLYDHNVLEVTEVTTEGAVIPDPQSFLGMVSDGLIGYGCVFGPFEELRSIPPGNGIVLCKIVVNVLADVDTTTTVTLADAPINPQRPVKNILTNDEGRSVFPDVSSATITIETRAPVIDALGGNAGLPGDVFTITGQNFGEPGLEVVVCGAAADFTLNGDTLTVTAPPCGTVGFAPVEVRTDRGSDIEENGFDYMEPPPENVDITDITPPSGMVGTEITITGENFDGPGLTVTICDMLIEGAMAVGGAIVVTVPDCGTVGPVNVVVRTDTGGSDSASFEITEEPPQGIPFRRGDPNDTGTVNISNPVFILNYLFSGFGEPKCLEAADINNDGSINVVDPVNLLNHLFGSGPAPAPPGFESCGRDPDEPGSSKDEGCEQYTHC